MHNRPRPGSRGGHDKFDWEEIKKDKHRMNYLGNSIRVPVTRSSTGGELFWYAKERGAFGANTTGMPSAQLEEELKEQKERETKLLGFYLARGFGSKPPGELIPTTGQGQICNGQAGRVTDELVLREGMWKGKGMVEEPAKIPIVDPGIEERPKSNFDEIIHLKGEEKGGRRERSARREEGRERSKSTARDRNRDGDGEGYTDRDRDRSTGRDGYRDRKRKKSNSPQKYNQVKRHQNGPSKRD